MPQVVGKRCGEVGYGMASLAGHPPVPSEEQAIAVLKKAIDAGCTMLNAGEFYGKPDYNSLVLLERYFTRYPDDASKVILNVKVAIEPNLKPNGNPDFVRQSIEYCRQQLSGKCKIDMFECGRKDINVPLETTLKTLAEFVSQGKIVGVALTEINAETIKQAAEITKIVAVEVELSLWCRDPLFSGIAETCAALDIPIISGMLTGSLKTPDDIPEGDFRRMFPRYQAGNFESNLKLVEDITRFAERKGCTAAQLALSWIRALSKRPNMPEIIPIPGSTNPGRVVENATLVNLSEEDMMEIEQAISKHSIHGDRYPAFVMGLTNLQALVIHRHGAGMATLGQRDIYIRRYRVQSPIKTLY